MKSTKQRQAILECLKSTDTHPTAEWIYANIKPYYPRLSLATVYRNLKEMAKSGIIRSVGVINGKERFDGNNDTHVHAVCYKCGKVLDLFDVEVPNTLIQQVNKRTDFNADLAEVKVYGLCPDCKNEK